MAVYLLGGGGSMGLSLKTHRVLYMLIFRFVRVDEVETNRRGRVVLGVY
jgi:hypothetical protein